MDERLLLNTMNLPAIPIVYCMRCALCWSDFSYRILQDEAIELLDVFEGELMPEWYETVNGDSFGKIGIALEPIPINVQTFYDKLNAGERITDEEVATIASFTSHFARPEVGGFPIVDVINQVCGRAFLQQRVKEPECVDCGQTMFFLASLCNDQEKGIRLVYDGGQIISFFCKKCKTITVRSSA
jgi:hypothetical protein